MRRPAVLAAAFAAALSAAFTAATATSAHAVPAGHVYFWYGTNQMGGQGAWDYVPGGYKEAPDWLKRHVYSFDSHASVTVYAISYQSGGDCLYREIRPDDYDNNWTAWAGKFDGVSDSTMGCEQG
ncbi:hypothetical protein BIV57_16660 [Mangrovactinospora gilvigrisea]|uniref:Uncharacterized protein n=1 Tax=Mangrovactinospora gilvigrisea TaxID=1428644 RepID=A0A1J7BCN9_9ACTN|nr:hypothetical protein [Mangrovactinospora gilvigrisea]OIV36357.1 hypothetical protein BIV57_16660 [Mangrovactinospora gilvigrisea]